MATRTAENPTIETDPFDRGLQELERARDVREVYSVLDRVTRTVEQRMPCMDCVPGCSACCNQQVLAGLAEWEVILAWIQAHLDSAQQRAIVRRAETLRLDGQSAISTWTRLADLDPSSDLYERTLNRALDNHDTVCPFLVDGRCSVYAARPAICRGYGRMMRTVQGAFYCDFILEQMNSATNDHVERLELPVFQPYHRAVLETVAGELDPVSALPIWILSHRAPDGALQRTAHPIVPDGALCAVDAEWSYDAEP